MNGPPPPSSGEARIVAWLKGQSERAIETACARIFLAGGAAWKMKRNVDLGYVDFSTLERRRWALDRELEFPYHPHVTVAQDLSDTALDAAYDGLSGFVARFPVGAFALFNRGTDGRWQWQTEFYLGEA